jgi:hypothetical protein
MGIKIFNFVISHNKVEEKNENFFDINLLSLPKNATQMRLLLDFASNFSGQINNALLINLKRHSENFDLQSEEFRADFNALKSAIADCLANETNFGSNIYVLSAKITTKGFLALIAAQTSDSSNKQVVRAFKYKSFDGLISNKSKLNTLNIECVLWGLNEFKSSLYSKHIWVHNSHPILNYEKNFSLNVDEIKRLLLLQDHPIQQDMKLNQHLSNYLKSLGELIESYE